MASHPMIRQAVLDVCPVVCTMTTEESERLCLKNGLCFHELLSAFSICQLRTQFRSVAHQFALTQLKVRFVRSTELQARPVGTTEEFMASELQTQGSDEEAMLSQRLNASSAEFQSMPWFVRYRRLLDESVRCLQYSMADCPAACLIVASTSDADPIAFLEQLSGTPALNPQGYRNGHFDPGSAERVFVLLHDVSAAAARPSTSDPAQIMAKAKARFGVQHCHLLCMNSLSGDTINTTQPDVWDGTLAAVFFKDQVPAADPMHTTRGCCLSGEDMLALRNFVQQVVMNNVVPAMEKRINNLNVAVSSARKGVKNVIKSWWRKPKEAASEPGAAERRGTAQYRFDQIESQILLLADSAFTMKDYDTALSMYRLVRDDFRADKALLHTAYCNTMIALCMVIMDGDRPVRRDAETCLREAIAACHTAQVSSGSHKKKEVTHATRLASRAALLLADLLSFTSGRFRDAAELLIRVGRDESNLSAAVLYEQASWHYYRGHFLARKFALQVIQAGIKYHTAGHTPHAVRCFTLSMGIYEGSAWHHILDYVYANLARHLGQLGDRQRSLACYARIVGAGRQAPERQHRFLSEFLALCKESPEAMESILEEVPPSRRVGDTSTAAPKAARVRVPKVVLGETQVLHCLNASHEPTAIDSMGADERVRWHRLACLLDAELPFSLPTDLPATPGALADDGEDGLSRLRQAARAMDSCLEDLARRGGAPPLDSPELCGMVGRGAQSSAGHHRPLGEPVSVRVLLENSLDIMVSISEAQLVVHFTPEGQAASNDQDEEDQKTGGEGRLMAMETADFSLEVAALFPKPEDGVVADEGALREGLATARQRAGAMFIDFQTVQFSPNTRREVFMRFCPLIPGKYEVFGVRWKLNEELWVYESLEQKGVLLQGSLEQRSRHIRAPNRSLTFSVASDMAWLSATIEGFRAPILQGEVHSGTLRLRNVGRATATTLLAKCSVPWLHLGNSPEAAGPASPSAPVAPLPGTASGTVHSSAFPSEILPGATAEVPVWVKGSAGSQTILLLLTYRSRDGDEVRRYLRLSFEITVQPSLVVNTRLAASRSTPGECLLSLDLSNARTDGDLEARGIFIQDVVWLSKTWSLEPATELPSVVHTVPGDVAVAVAPGERVSLPLRVLRRPHTSSVVEAWRDATTPAARLALGLATLEDLTALAKRLLAEAKQERLVALREAEAPRSISSVRRERATAATGAQQEQMDGSPNAVDTHLVSPAALCARRPFQLSLLVIWRRAHNLGAPCPAFTSILHITMPTSGLAIACPIDPSPQLPSRGRQRRGIMPQRLTKESTDLELTLTHDVAIVHDFDANGSVRIPVRARVGNRADAGNPHVSFVFTLARAAARPSLVSWSGSIRRKVVGLGPGQSVDVDLVACISHPGVYDLNEFELHVVPHGGKTTATSALTFSMQSIITVGDIQGE
mmetsp:Transcript_665/g.2083  ORF Transcript_665/g.2083 Transcript_665/m.2083 type:complete len:1435 (-) Transcript_665:249-4553(-)